MLRVNIWIVSLSALALIGCGSKKSPPPAPDASVSVDAHVGTDATVSHPDAGPGAGPLGTCAMPTMVTGMLGTTSMIPFDTTMGPDGPLDLGMCGSGVTPAAAQAVIAYQVPGTGTVAVEFTTIDGTPDTFDTVVQVRTASCTMVPAAGTFPTCFDDADPNAGELRSAGAVSAMGGTTIYFIVTGYTGSMDHDVVGAGRLDVTPRMDTAPTLTTAVGRNYGTRVEIDATGMDVEGDAAGLVLTFLDASGMGIDANGDGMVDDTDTLLANFDTDQTGMMSFSSRVTLNDAMMQITMAMATQVRVLAFDTGAAASAAMMIPLPHVTEVGVGHACDATNVCYHELTCSGTGTTMCAAAAAQTTACAGATALTLPTLSGTTAAMSMVMGTIPDGMGIFHGSCGGDGGSELLYSFTTPASITQPFDIVLSTDIAASGMADTTLYARTACADPATEPMNACNDDVDLMSGDVLSTIELDNVAASTSYTVFVDQYPGTAMGATMFGLQVTLRPVLPPGATCDPAGMMNRCMTGTCLRATTGDGGIPMPHCG